MHREMSFWVPCQPEWFYCYAGLVVHALLKETCHAFQTKLPTHHNRPAACRSSRLLWQCPYPHPPH
ncbi:hypothetical protein CO2235_MP60051 [Cupriavidus oxalaticus]|uniref:Uncharacterized protein n=1 Tax=Cupriavidus oxalaticus TaxID=96344 RepID=A0A375GP00_9BURK|nr:hypothetical protein CO2235_MP60051 [Cupriavidus oxalaticus]